VRPAGPVSIRLGRISRTDAGRIARFLKRGYLPRLLTRRGKGFIGFSIGSQHNGVTHHLVEIVNPKHVSQAGMGDAEGFKLPVLVDKGSSRVGTGPDRSHDLPGIADVIQGCSAESYFTGEIESGNAAGARPDKAIAIDPAGEEVPHNDAVIIDAVHKRICSSIGMDAAELSVLESESMKMSIGPKVVTHDRAEAI